MNFSEFSAYSKDFTRLSRRSALGDLAKRVTHRFWGEEMGDFDARHPDARLLWRHALYDGGDAADLRHPGQKSLLVGEEHADRISHQLYFLRLQNTCIL